MHTFVVLAYKQSPHLANCLETLRAQETASRIVVSTSTPSAFVRRAAKGLKVIVNPVASGIASDWNFGLRTARTRFVTLAHQDDTYSPDFLSKTLATMEETGAAVCFTGYQEIDSAGLPKSSKISKVKHLIEMATIGRSVSPGRLQMRAFLSFGNPLPCSSVTFDTEHLPDFRFSDAWSSNLDWEAWWRLNDDGVRFAHVPERLVGRRHDEHSTTATLLKDGTRAKEDLLMFRRAWPRPFSKLIAFAYRVGY